MALHVIVGASSVGVAVAKQLAHRGEEVRLVTRSGKGPEIPQVRRIPADVTDSERLCDISTGATALYNCASPAYDRWPTDWPPLASAFLIAAERTGAVLASYSNVYGYGPVSGLMTEETPLAATHPKLRVRADMWREALERHSSGRLRTVEVRSTDHIQPNSMFALALCKPLLAGKRAVSPVPLDVPRSWTSVNDAAKLLVAVASKPETWGQAWHTPTQEPMTARELLNQFVNANGLEAPRVTVIPYPVLRTAGIFVPMLRELRSTHYQFDRPFLMDSSKATAAIGMHAEPIVETLRETARILSDANRVDNGRG
ncbi:nucleoside-diphosphate-sugar epimerase [Haloferula luteola]|uniref:Nucleoside-diphosphate-sugar epimerase n=1 Tax=Haloferula luteola TaxID=595692 RepID=A0A840V0S2_9BACT|nr:NAD-dependent epimerase/dehydratase family protein [Haloferula luteola]MBB5350933.1 nucleoside-diphosphate-sugar epimerase [Haloferula luteola]